jgi:ribosomal protein S18 acetylase RimI-like enzyme
VAIARRKNLLQLYLVTEKTFSKFRIERFSAFDFSYFLSSSDSHYNKQLGKHCPYLQFVLMRTEYMGKNSKTKVRRAVLGDEQRLRELRLQAMSDSPSAFGSTYERELARTTFDWQRWLAPGVTFIVDAPDGAGGIVAGVRDATEQKVIYLMAMWVHPAIRGSGVGDDLVDAVVAWAAAEGARIVRLDVMQSNEYARRCYERNGFRLNGQEFVREGDGRLQVCMERLVASQVQK